MALRQAPSLGTTVTYERARTDGKTKALPGILFVMLLGRHHQSRTPYFYTILNI